MYDRRRLEEGFDLAEHARRLANVVRIGVVAEVDPDAYRMRVRYDTDDDGTPILTAPVPWVVARAGSDSAWWAPEAGEQVLLLAPSGELTQAIALPALYSDARPAPSSDPDKHVIEHSDGAVLTYDRAAHRYEIALPSAGAFAITVGGASLELSAQRCTVTVGGASLELTPAGLMHAGVNVGSTHVHGGVMSGGAATLVPQ